MAIIEKIDNGKKRVVDISGPQGNAYWLIAYANKLGKKLKLNTKKINKEMTSGDYENLIKVFDNYFGDFVDLER